jgi:hypothetical protein
VSHAGQKETKRERKEKKRKGLRQPKRQQGDQSRFVVTQIEGSNCELEETKREKE